LSWANYGLWWKKWLKNWTVRPLSIRVSDTGRRRRSNQRFRHRNVWQKKFVTSILGVLTVKETPKNPSLTRRNNVSLATSRLTMTSASVCFLSVLHERKQIREENIAQSGAVPLHLKQHSTSYLQSTPPPPPQFPIYVAPRCVPKAPFLPYLPKFIYCISRDIRTLRNSCFERFTVVVCYDTQRRHLSVRWTSPRQVLSPAFSYPTQNKSCAGVLTPNSVRNEHHIHLIMNNTQRMPLDYIYYIKFRERVGHEI
jgi:hypothetical protein